jgi:putative addiction module component (TIGR02574 family)
MTTVDRLLADAMDLSERERVELASRIFATVPDLELDEAWRDELVSRAAEHDADPEASLAWDDAMKLMLAPISRR